MVGNAIRAKKMIDNSFFIHLIIDIHIHLSPNERVGDKWLVSYIFFLGY